MLCFSSWVSGLPGMLEQGQEQVIEEFVHLPEEAGKGDRDEGRVGPFRTCSRDD